jgi:hypothetical protein
MNDRRPFNVDIEFLTAIHVAYFVISVALFICAQPHTSAVSTTLRFSFMISFSFSVGATFTM